MTELLDIRAREAEIDERIAVLRRYRRILELQRERLESYLVLIDTRSEAISSGNLDVLQEYAIQESQVVKSIMSVQRCLEPLAEMYKKVAPEGSPDIDELQDRLGRLRDHVLVRNEETRQILRNQMEDLRDQIASLRIPKRAPAAYSTLAPSLIDISG